jgi:hypothetical protein
MMTTPEDETGRSEKERQFFFDIEELPGYTNAELFSGVENADQFLDAFGHDLVTRTLVHSDKLSVYHETAKPGETVKPHRHGTYQLNYVLRGELIFGRRHVGAGMGFFSPDMLYSWRAGEEGAEWIEIHAGQPGIFFTQRR